MLNKALFSWHASLLDNVPKDASSKREWKFGQHIIRSVPSLPREKESWCSKQKWSPSLPLMWWCPLCASESQAFFKREWFSLSLYFFDWALLLAVAGGGSMTRTIYSIFTRKKGFFLFASIVWGESKDCFLLLSFFFIRRFVKIKDILFLQVQKVSICCQ